MGCDRENAWGGRGSSTEPWDEVAQGYEEGVGVAKDDCLERRLTW